MTNFFKTLQVKLSSIQKKIIITLFDLTLLSFSIYLSLLIRYESFNIYFLDNLFTFLIGLFLFFLFSIIFKINQQIIRTFNISNVIFFLKVIFLFTFIFFILIYLINFPNSPRSIPLFTGPIFFLIFITSRLLILYLTNNMNQSSAKIPVLIYGAGSSGVFFNEILTPNKKVIGFIDDDDSKIGRNINNIRVYNYSDINNLIKAQNIKEIIVAIPRLNLIDRKNFSKKLKKFQIKVNFVTLSRDYDNTNNNLNFDEVRLYDLIDRDLRVDFDLNKNFFNKTVIITGAGGSIGSELSRQILMSDPKNLIFIDFSELNLFNLQKNINVIKDQFKISSKVKYKLLNLCNYHDLEALFLKIKDEIGYVDFVFHCAAYKHVNLVEDNKFISFKNNMLATINSATLSDRYNVNKFVLISSDKAVRPKSMMGITKYLSEIYVLKIGKISDNTIFSIVRFGNVLGSSGSVLPIFNNQIKNGGPITVTHTEATRFFMTIEEASYLVIQASIIAEKLDILLINMGNPIKVIDLARKLLSSLGLKEKTKNNQNGIEIKIIGLKDGEKLHEELLIDKHSIKTINENLMIAKEDDKINFNLDEFNSFLNDIIKKNSENYLIEKLNLLNINN